MTEQEVEAPWPFNPKPFLSIQKGRQIAVKLKWGLEYRGKLVSYDNYMNIKLKDTVEYAQGKELGKLGEVLIRCNNVLYVRQLEDRLVKKEET
eukprot:Clim_evm59s210 gene=Clim_evmTU59s210